MCMQCYCEDNDKDIFIYNLWKESVASALLRSVLYTLITQENLFLFVCLCLF